ncbi:sensor histidine kinase [Clostridium akagii]|uniref:sensor histidine kinase n=1 Tax=Clostridium akagii TaxID=91623 RepID=UPI00047E8156|nr:HAMP domain-containing sensor histidine kinase [Clostridium akagii]
MNIKFFKKAKISVKLTIIYAIMFSLILLILNASVLLGIKNYFYSQGNKQVGDVNNIFINNVGKTSGNIDVSDKKLLLNIPAKENLFIKVTQNNGKILNVSDRFHYKIANKEPYNIIQHLEEQDRHLLYENIKIKSNKYGTVNLQIVKDMDREYDFMKILFALMATADFIGIILSIFIGYFMSKRMLKPIDNITKIAENISINNLKERIDIKGPEDELKRLGSTFNTMINRLQDSFDRQAEFVSDASHELRTPIAVIKGYANLLDRWGKDDREALEKSIYAIKFEASNMADMVEQLPFLAKGDSGAYKMEKSNFMLNELIDQVLDESSLIAKNKVISSDQNDITKIFADYNTIKQMLRIFIENSIKFTPEQGKIVINSVVHNKSVEIMISDTGIGIPKEEIENVFDRFYTVDKSRAKEKTGTGLGLSIAKRIADLHGGTIKLTSEEGKGTKVSVKLNLSV